MPRFFIEKENIFENIINIVGEDVNHIKRVLRLQCGNSIIVCDGSGKDYIVEIEKFETDSIRTNILRVESNITEPPIDVVLYQGIPKSDKMDFIIQKSVELGVKKIVPVITEHTVVKLDNEKDSQKKSARWQKIALEAAKQSNRGVIPKVELPIRFDDALEQSKTSDIRIIPYEKEIKNGLKNIIQDNIKNISVFIGPEGGFSEKEISNAEKAGIVPVTLGPRILRTETAGIVVLSILMYELGDANK